ncbi:Glutamate receptor ionotropic, delta-2 [Datura stramonium]|uniref:Glutamate receptor ionotropic, delta-2 n=1 Tax=Datura stramonium TaxID=4076 RepID=A0ABS8S778_DATST|nr:Glutamate receptor ionotropic, delta-2 [Datura stramonium]
MGVVLDLDTELGHRALNCLRIAHSDFYSRHPNYTTRLVPSCQGLGRKCLELLKFVKVDAPRLMTLRLGAIAATCQTFQWNRVVIIYEDSDYGNGIVPYLSNALQYTNARIAYKSLIPVSAHEDFILKELYKMMTMQTRVFIVHVSHSLGAKLFLKAMEIGMMSEGYVWIVTSDLMDLLPSMNLHVVEAMQGVLGCTSTSYKILNVVGNGEKEVAVWTKSDGFKRVRHNTSDKFYSTSTEDFSIASYGQGNQERYQGMGSSVRNYDAAIEDITITGNRSNYALTLPFGRIGGVARIVPITYEDDNDMWTFLKPMKKELWLTSIAFFFVTAGCTHLSFENQQVFPKGSPLVADVSRAVIKLTEIGEMLDIQQEWSISDPTCNGCPDSISAMFTKQKFSSANFGIQKYGLSKIKEIARHFDQRDLSSHPSIMARDPQFKYPKAEVAETVSSSQSVDLSNSNLMVLSLPMNILSTHSNNIAVPNIPTDSTFSSSTVLLFHRRINTTIDATDR